MGAPMAKNLLKAGYKLNVYNRSDRPRVQEVIDAGGVRVSSPKEAAACADVVISIVTDTPDMEAVLIGEDGAIHGVKEGAVVIDMSTVSPKVTQEVAAALKEKGVGMLDAPVSGGDVGAINATLSIMVGGEQAVFDECMPVFEAMGNNINLIGSNGAGQTTKLCNQIAVSVNNLGMAEALMYTRIHSNNDSGVHNEKDKFSLINLQSKKKLVSKPVTSCPKFISISLRTLPIYPLLPVISIFIN